MDILAALKKQPLFKSYIAGTAADISKAEEKLKLSFSAEYKQYLLKCGFATYDGHEITGICKAKRLNVVDVTIMEREYTEIIPSDWYVIEQLNIDAIVIWQSSSGEIYQTSPNTEPEKICESLADYICESIPNSV